MAQSIKVHRQGVMSTMQGAQRSNKLTPTHLRVMYIGSKREKQHWTSKVQVWTTNTYRGLLPFVHCCVGRAQTWTCVHRSMLNFLKEHRLNEHLGRHGTEASHNRIGMHMVSLSSQVCSQHTLATGGPARFPWYPWRFLTDAVALGYRLRLIHHGVFAVIVQGGSTYA